MNAAETAQLAVILAPLVQELVIEGNKMVVTMREKITQEDLNKALDLSKSATWPELDFKARA